MTDLKNFYSHLVISLAFLFLSSCAGPLPNKNAGTKSGPFSVMEATIPQLQNAMAGGQITSEELVTTYLDRINAYDQKGASLNAISAINSNAREEAIKLDDERRTGKVRGPLHGIPIIVKDNYETKGMQTADGSKLLAGWIPPDDAALVKKLHDAGVIIIAKSNMHEFARGITTVGTLFGATRNPYAPTKNPGGSSGGTGAAIAANFAAAGMGSDTCGSIRIPASRNSLVGIRGTQGLISRKGIIPLSHTMDIGGPLARSVGDVAIILDAVVGYDPFDPQTAASVGNIPKSYLESLDPMALRGARVGLLRDLLVKDLGDEEVAAVIQTAVEEMKAAGAEIIEISMPRLGEQLAYRNGETSRLISLEFKFDFDTYLAAHPSAPIRSLGDVISSKIYDSVTEEKLKEANSPASQDTKEYFEELARRNTLREIIVNAMAGNKLDAIIYPTIRRTANLIGENQFGSNCVLAAGSGLPAISIPSGYTKDGVPVGVELLGRAWSEPKLLGLAYSYEQSTRHRHPPESTPELHQAKK